MSFHFGSYISHGKHSEKSTFWENTAKTSDRFVEQEEIAGILKDIKYDIKQKSSW